MSREYLFLSETVRNAQKCGEKVSLTCWDQDTVGSSPAARTQMYYTLHEADISKFVDIANQRLSEYFPKTNLKRIRTAYGCTQAELAQKSGVSLLSIQMYEQRNKDINKASVDTVHRLAKVLGCTVEYLIER